MNKKTHYIIAIMLSSFLSSCDEGFTLAGGNSGNSNYSDDYRVYTKGYCSGLDYAAQFNCYYIVDVLTIKSTYGDEIYRGQLRLYNALNENNIRSYIVARVGTDHKMDPRSPVYMPPPGSLCPDACDITLRTFVMPRGETRRLSVEQSREFIRRAQSRFAGESNIRQVELPGEVIADHASLRDCRYMLVHHVRIEGRPKVLVIALDINGAALRPEYYVIDGDNLCPDACDVF